MCLLKKTDELRRVAVEGSYCLRERERERERTEREREREGERKRIKEAKKNPSADSLAGALYGTKY